MKNLKKLTKQELKSISGGEGTYVYCNVHTQRACFDKCIPIGQICLPV